MSRTEYEYGYVAFIDVLGWSNFVAESVKNPDLLNRLADVLKRVEERVVSILKPDDIEQPFYLKNSKAYQFSDAHFFTVVVRKDTRIGAEFVAEWSRLIAREYFRAGFLVRGGITIGRLVQKQNICFGPAVTRAYQLEQSVFLPMIIVDPDIRVQQYFMDEEQYGASSVEGQFTYNFFAKTSDGRVFIDFLRKDVCTEEDFRPLDVFAENEFEKLMASHAVAPDDSLSVRAKKAWFFEYAASHWRNSKSESISQINFTPHPEMVRRILMPKNYVQDFED